MKSGISAGAQVVENFAVRQEAHGQEIKAGFGGLGFHRVSGFGTARLHDCFADQVLDESLDGL